MAFPTLASLRRDPLLTELGIGYFNRHPSQARQIFAPTPVTQQSAYYPIFSKSDFFRDEGDAAAIRAPGTPPSSIDYRISSAQFTCAERAFRKYTPPEKLNPGIAMVDIDQADVAAVMKKLAIRQDRRFAAAFLTTGCGWGTEVNGSSDDTGNLAAIAGDPIKKLRDHKAAIQLEIELEPNVLVLSRDVYDSLCEHAAVRGRLATTKDQMVNAATLATLCDLERVVVFDRVYNSAAEGASAAMTRMVTQTALLVYQSSSPSEEEPSGGRIFQFTDLDKIGANGEVVISQYDHPDKGVGGRYVDARSYDAMAITAADAGRLIINALGG